MTKAYELRLNGVPIGRYLTREAAEKGIEIELRISSLHALSEYSIKEVELG